MRVSKAEAETIIRWDEEGSMATVYTASPSMARKCQRWGWPLTVHSRYQGEPRSWQAEVPKRAVRLTKRSTIEKAKAEAAKRVGVPFGKAHSTAAAPKDDGDSDV